MNQQDNKSIVLDFYKRVIGERDTEYANQIVKEDYIQHSPMVKTGKAGFLEAIEFLKKFPQPENPPKPFMRVIADEEYVVLHMEIELMGQKKAVLDIFRLEDGLLTEHWDAIQDIPDTTVNGNAMVRGSADIEDNDLTNQNKAVITEYSQQIAINRKFDRVGDWVSNDLIQHHPHIGNGLDGLKSLYGQTEITQIHLVFGEGNFVCTQSSGKVAGLPSVIYDIYRLKEEKIVEHWSVSQTIPEKMPHNNGVI